MGGKKKSDVDVEDGGESGVVKKHSKKNKDKRDKVSDGSSLMRTSEIDKVVEKNTKKKRHEPADGIVSEHVDVDIEKRKNGKKRLCETADVIASVEVDNGCIKKKKKRKNRDKLTGEASIIVVSEDAQLGDAEDHSMVKKRKKQRLEVHDGVVSEEVHMKSKKKKKHKMTKELPDNSTLKVDEKQGLEKVKKRKRNSHSADSFEKRNSKGKCVNFSDKVEVFPLPEHLKYRKLNSEGDLVQGKRYSLEEDAKIMQAVDDYILKKGLATDCADKDLDEDWNKARNMIMNCKEHRELNGCWKDIALAIPWRTLDSIYQRAHLIYESAVDRKWTKDEINMILNFHKEHGPKWRDLGDFLGKSRKHVKDAYRRNKLTTEKKGAWSQEEYQKLFDLVNHDICLKAVQEKKVKHGMLRDNIAWGAISESIRTRTSPTCCNKWYYQLCSSMVVEGIWSDTDDYKLVDALYSQDACCIEDVEWDKLLEHRSADLCQRRWDEMSRNLGEHRLKPFLEQVEIFHQRYNRDVIEARETYEKKDPVDV